MEENLLLEQYGKFKKIELKESPYRCLLNTEIEMNPHQINAFIAAIHALKTGGLVLADEVGLGKTIEAGLVLKYVLDTGAKRVLIALPATLRKQWEVELDEKFNLKATILDRLTVEKDYYGTKTWIEDPKAARIIITSYDYASKLMKRFPSVKWDFLIIDEAHNLRNVFHGTKRAKRLYDLTKGIPKILLTATPLQNSLIDLHGLLSYIDPRIFGDEKVFVHRYVDSQDYEGLKRELAPVLYRTLRRDVGKYMDFKKRECRTIDFRLSPDEAALYYLVNEFLKKPVLYSIPTSNRGLITLVIRKLLASSSFALVETFEVLATRLEKLKEGTKSADAQEGFDLFWNFVEDEIDEEAFGDQEDEDTVFQKQLIQEELDEVRHIIEIAGNINPSLLNEFVIKNADSVIRTARPDMASVGKEIQEKVRKSADNRDAVFYLPRENSPDMYFINGERILFYKDKLKEIDGELVSAEPLTTLWDDILSNNLHNEGGVSFPKGKKPEHLIKRVFEIATNKGDWVLDSFLGSGTTVAVAHKMGRRYIGIEMGEQAYTHCKKRLDSVISDTDNSGISKAVDWHGGGGYHFYELAPSLLIKNDKLPVYQVNPEYTFEMMCEAICKLEGFRYKPGGNFHGYSSEKRFIHITKEFVNAEYVMSVATTLGEDQSLLIYGTKIQSDLRLPDNIEVKKIPKDLLEKCDFESEVR